MQVLPQWSRVFQLNLGSFLYSSNVFKTLLIYARVCQSPSQKLASVDSECSYQSYEMIIRNWKSWKHFKMLWIFFSSAGAQFWGLALLDCKLHLICICLCICVSFVFVFVFASHLYFSVAAQFWGLMRRCCWIGNCVSAPRTLNPKLLPALPPTLLVLFGQIHLPIYTNIFCKLAKYI